MPTALAKIITQNNLGGRTSLCLIKIKIESIKYTFFFGKRMFLTLR